MNIEMIRQKVDGIPHMEYAQAVEMTRFILEHGFTDLLELGFAHGVSTCYMAGALDELGRGSLTTIDLTLVKKYEPNVDTLLNSLGLAKYVAVYYEPTSYIWRLMKMLDENPAPRFDFCYLDGAHSWFVDGFAFFLVDKLLKPGGWIIFDDLDWSYAGSPSLSNTDMVIQMPPDEKQTRQVRKVYELLAQTHEHYGNFSEKDGWGYAHKLPERITASGGIKTVTVYQKEYVGLGGALLTIAKKVAGRFRK